MGHKLSKITLAMMSAAALNMSLSAQAQENSTSIFEDDDEDSYSGNRYQSISD